MELNNTIIFDGVCNLCNASVKFIIKRDNNNIFKFLPIQSKRAHEIRKTIKIDFENIDTVILIRDNNIYCHSDAALEIAGSLDYPWKIFHFFKFVPKFIRDGIYRIIAWNRYQWFGKKESCMIPTDDIKSKFLDYN